MTKLYSLYRQHLATTPVLLDRDGLAAAQNTVANTALTLAGALASGGTYTAGDGGSSGNVGHLIGVYSSANIAADVFTIVGTDPDGLALTETVTGVNASTVFTTKYFYTVSSVKNDTTEAVNQVEVGIGNTFATRRIPIEPRASGFDVGLGVTVTGTISVTVQLTMDDIFDPTVTPVYIADTTFATKTATFFSALGVLVTAVRFITNSYSSGATATFHVIQNK